ncbi:hypothetical protein AB832_02260 [Flavobacteriaceae bacterium (ex Bugula neritina AB1)]|nr:hypothetical protein AB832_02260 [Flavobacteriaceae bacterium (ex Bugula neritina AB1)]
MLITFNFSANTVRVISVENQPFFVAKDVCDVLGLKDTNMSLSKLDDDEKLTQKVFVSGQNRKTWLISESGLYNLIFRSTKPQAKAFRKWVTSEVLPTIRQTGGYVAKGKPRQQRRILEFSACLWLAGGNIDVLAASVGTSEHMLCMYKSFLFGAKNAQRTKSKLLSETSIKSIEIALQNYANNRRLTEISPKRKTYETLKNVVGSRANLAQILGVKPVELSLYESGKLSEEIEPRIAKIGNWGDVFKLLEIQDSSLLNCILSGLPNDRLPMPKAEILYLSGIPANERPKVAYKLLLSNLFVNLQKSVVPC